MFTVKTNIKIPKHSVSPSKQQATLTLSSDLNNKTMNEPWETNEHENKKPRIHRNTNSEKSKLENYLTQAGLFDDFPHESKNTDVTCQQVDLTNLSTNEWIDVHSQVMNIVPYQITQQTYANARMTTSPTLSMQSASDVQAFEWKKSGA